MMCVKGEVVGLIKGKTRKGNEYVGINILSRGSDGTAGIVRVYDYNGRCRGVKVGEQVEIEFWCRAYAFGQAEAQVGIKYVGVQCHSGGGVGLRAAV